MGCGVSRQGQGGGETKRAEKGPNEGNEEIQQGQQQRQGEHHRRPQEMQPGADGAAGQAGEVGQKNQENRDAKMPRGVLWSSEESQMCRKMFSLLFTDGVLRKEADLALFLSETAEASAAEVAKEIWPELVAKAGDLPVTWEVFRAIWQTPPRATTSAPKPMEKIPPVAPAVPTPAPAAAPAAAAAVTAPATRSVAAHVPGIPSAAPPAAGPAAADWFSSEDLATMSLVLSHGDPSSPHLAITGAPDDWEWVSSLGEALEEIGFKVAYDDDKLHDAPIFVLVYSERSERSETLLRHTTRAAEVCFLSFPLPPFLPHLPLHF